MEDPDPGTGSEGAQINIAEAMGKLIKRLEQRFEGIPIPIKPILEEDWSENYAIVNEWFLDFHKSEYDKVGRFDPLAFLQKFQGLLLAYFGADAKFSVNSDGSPFPVGTVVINLHFMEQEIEVYRKGMAFATSKKS